MLIVNRPSSLRSPGSAELRAASCGVPAGGGREAGPAAGRPRGGCDEPRERLRNGRAFLLSPRRFWSTKDAKM